jgi:hypothetical protein
MSYTAVCNECGYSGPDWEATASAHSWGRCPKCKTTNLDVTVICDVCGTQETEVYGSLTRCLKCHPEPGRQSQGNGGAKENG